MIGVPRVHHRATDSTNERAKELARAGAPHGTLVTADEQSAGRGRQGREWTAPAGSAVLMSVVLRDLGEAQELLPLAAAVAACEAAEAVAPVQCRVKWPNDVWVDGRKLAGILIEGRPQEGWAVLGIGLNVTTPEFPPELARHRHLAGDRGPARAEHSERGARRAGGAPGAHGWPTRRRRSSRPGASATRCWAAPCAGTAARAPPPASTTPARCWSRRAPERSPSTRARSTC